MEVGFTKEGHINMESHRDIEPKCKKLTRIDKSVQDSGAADVVDMYKKKN